MIAESRVALILSIVALVWLAWITIFALPVF